MTDWSNAAIDRLGSRLKAGAIDQDMLVSLDSYRESFRPSYDFVVSRISSALKLPITGRPAKSTTAIVDKLNRQNTRLSQVQDIAGCRVVVEDIFVQDRALGALEVYLDSPLIYDRRDSPSHGYRSIHLIASVAGRRVEVQLRTELQHLWAEISEKMSDTIGASIKYGSGDAEALRLLKNLSLGVARVEAEESGRRDFMRAVERSGGVLHKRARKQVKEVERRFFAKRSQLLQLLRDIHEDYSSEAA